MAGSPVECSLGRHLIGSALRPWRRAANWVNAASIEATSPSVDWASCTKTIFQ